MDNNPQTATVTCKIINVRGLHARASRKFVELVVAHACHVRVSKDDLTVDGTSIMDLLMLGAARGSKITIDATGTDAQSVVQKLENLISTYFGEEQ